MKIFQSADAIITQTNAIKKRIINIFNVNANKINIVPNGVDESRFNPIRWYLETVGNLERRKNGKARLSLCIVDSWMILMV